MRNKPDAYEIIKPTLFFSCEYGVYRKNGDSSLCYTTDKKRAELIKRAMTCYQNSMSADEFDKVIEEIQDQEQQVPERLTCDTCKEVSSKLSNPNTVYINMLRGTIATPSIGSLEKLLKSARDKIS